MKMKALTLGAVIGFVTAIAPSCGMTTGNCGPNNCTGCCSNGMCISTLTDALCGSAGNACSNCTTSGQTCNTMTKSCIGAVSTGGGTASTGGGTASTGGGTASTGGGSASTGGGSASTGGGAAGLMDCNERASTCPAGTLCVIDSVSSASGDGKCRPGDCSPVAQDCAANQKCVVGPRPDGGFGSLCIPFTLGDGGVADDQPCTPSPTNPEPCQVGAQCINGRCARHCSITPGFTGCVGMTECFSGVSFTNGMGGTFPGEYRLCLTIPPCDPYDPAACGATDVCQVYRTDRLPGCFPPGMSTSGQACTMESCAKGLQCVGNNMNATCRPFCNLDGGMPRCTAADAGCSSLMGTGFGTCTL